MADPYVGEIRAFAFAFNPIDWLLCDGAIVPVPQYQALYAVIGNTYGGTPNQTFALPDLRGDAIIGVGQGSGLSPYTLGQQAGAPTVTLNETQMPSHTHQSYLWKPSPTNTAVPAPAASSYPTSIFTTANGTSYAAIPEFLSSANTTLAPAALTSYPGTGGAHVNTQPYLGLLFCICTSGNFPIRP
jgi:microcystin-dependent protein